MKLCPVCHHCYADSDISCVHADHAVLTPSRPGTRWIDGKYLLDWWLGSGSMSTVYAGTHVEIDRSVAVKLLRSDGITDPQLLDRFSYEARAAVLLQHPNVAEIYGYGSPPEGEAYIIMELVKGWTLHQYTNMMGPLPFATAALIAEQIADGLEAVHQCGILHGGLNPSNILLTRDEHDALRVKIVGLGLATLREQIISGNLPPTTSESLISTFRYASPEQTAGQAMDARSDIYSLGVILYELLAGRPPFDAPTAMDLKFKQINEDPPSLKNFRADAPDALAQLIMEALHKDPEARPQNAAEMARRLYYLEDVLNVREPMASPRPAAAPVTLERPSLRRFLPFAYAALFLTLGLGGLWLVQSRMPSRPSVAKTTPSPLPTLAGPRLVKVNPPTMKSNPWPAVPATGLGSRATSPAPPSDPPADKTPSPLTRPAPQQARMPEEKQAPAGDEPSPAVKPHNATPLRRLVAPQGAHAALQSALDNWIATTNARDLEKQKRLYMPTVAVFYRNQNVSRSRVFAEKARLFGPEERIDVRAREPKITLSRDGRTAAMQFRKQFVVGDEGQSPGEVMQELRWRKTDTGWKIMGEREVP